MAAKKTDNRRFLLRLWIPTLLFGGVVVFLIVAALGPGDPERILPALVGLVVAGSIIAITRWRQKRRMSRMFQLADPLPMLRSFEASARRIPHGAHMAAASTATVLALYGRIAEADQALSTVSWQDVPPLIQAQESAARAIMAYANRHVSDGLDYAATAAQQASIDLAIPGARTSELAIRTYRNLGLALSGSTTETTEQELRIALSKLPTVGPILAAWGLAMIAKQKGDEASLHTMRHFIENTAPHLEPVLESIG